MNQTSSRILHVVGARPNFMKIAPIMRAMTAHPEHFSQLLVHTGQHYDQNMSKVFFEELQLPQPDINLEVGSGTHARQTAEVMVRFEEVVQKHHPDWVFVVGDVNSTLACTLVSAKLGIKVAHVEAGLRSFDRTMPEEINRLVTDQIADLLFTPSADGDQNLLREGIAPERIHLVGNVMIDTLVQLLPTATARWPELRNRLGLDRYVLVTLHRPGNVDDPDTLAQLVEALRVLSCEIPILFPVHPRTRQRLAARGQSSTKNFQMIDPLGYLDFLALEQHAQIVLTDSGGVQEETTYLRVPCLTIRPNTERPITITLGTNRLVASQPAAILAAARAALQAGAGKPAQPPPLWDGHAAQRIVDVMQRL